MNHSPFWPLVWKEYRASRAFWLSMAVMGLVAQAGVRYLARASSQRDLWLYTIALAISAGFAVGIGGTMFAAEYEERTIALLRRLPIRARELGVAKLFTAVASLVALIASLWFAARGMAGQTLAPVESGRLWGTWGLACAEGLGWGILFSLVIPRPLWATLVAALTVVAADVWLIWPDRSGATIPDYASSFGFRIGLLLVVIAADALLLPNWLLGRRATSMTWFRAWRAGTASRRAIAHLVWQTFREGLLSFLLLAAGAIVIGLINLSALSRDRSGTALFFGVMLLAAIQGALVFRADQSHGPRFLAQCGTSPRLVWLSRHLVWGSWFWLCSIFILFLVPIRLIELLHDWTRDPSYYPWAPWGRFAATTAAFVLGPFYRYLLPLATAYTAGQMLSLFVRRTLLAVTFSMLLAGLLAGWVAIMVFIGAPFWWSVLPLPIGFFLATWLRMPDWLIERNGWRAWPKPVAAALLPVAALCLAVPTFRVWQIPPRDLKLPILEGGLDRGFRGPAALAEANATLELYRNAADRWDRDRSQAVDSTATSGTEFTLHPEDEAWARPIVELALEASRDKADLLLLPVRVRFPAAARIEKMETLLLQFAAQQQEAGHLDAAFDAYLAALRADWQRYQCDAAGKSRRAEIIYAIQLWGAAPGQTVEQIRQAIAQLRSWHAQWPTPEELVLPVYQQSQMAIENLSAAATAGVVDGRQVSELEWMMSEFSWERARAQRLLKWLTNVDLMSARHSADAMNTGSEIASFSHSDTVVGLYRGELRPAGIMGAEKWLPTTPLIERTAIARQGVDWQMICDETDYRATLLILALEAWRVEHGSLPETLNELVGHGLDALPVDPWQAQTFGYIPTGTALDSIEPWLFNEDEALRRPFVFSEVYQFQIHSQLDRWWLPGEQAVGLIEFPTGLHLKWTGPLGVFYMHQGVVVHPKRNAGTIYFIPGARATPADESSAPEKPETPEPPPSDEPSTPEKPPTPEAPDADELLSPPGGTP